MVLSAGLLAAGILAGGILLGSRSMPAFGGQNPQSDAIPAALVQFNTTRTDPIGGREAPTDESVRRELHTQVALLRSRYVLGEALSSRDASNLAFIKGEKDPISWLAARLRVEVLPDTSLIRVTMEPASGGRPKEQATLINAVIDTFIKQSLEFQARTIERRIKHLVEELRQWEQQLKQFHVEVIGPGKTAEAEDSTPIPKEALSSYSLDLRKKQLEIELERAGVEASLDRRKGQVDASERTRLEERLAALGAQEQVLRRERGWVAKWSRESTAWVPGHAEAQRDEIHLATTRIDKIKDQIMALDSARNAEFDRLRLIDRAVAP
jgi:hypothetical protein